MFRLTAINKEQKKNELKEIASFPIGSFFFVPSPLFSFFDFVSASLISFVFEIEHRISQKKQLFNLRVLYKQIRKIEEYNR